MVVTLPTEHQQSVPQQRIVNDFAFVVATPNGSILVDGEGRAAGVLVGDAPATGSKA